MFNSLSPADVVAAIGATLRTAARSEGEMSPFERDQLMSAYSAARHLAVELDAFEPELRSFGSAAVEQVRASRVPGLEQELGRLIAALDGSPSATDLGETMCTMFEHLRRSGTPEADALRSALHGRLRALADREVDLLADTLG